MLKKKRVTYIPPTWEITNGVLMEPKPWVMCNQILGKIREMS